MLMIGMIVLILIQGLRVKVIMVISIISMLIMSMIPTVRMKINCLILAGIHPYVQNTQITESITYKYS
ncbi:MAG: hypothetical protein CME32_26910 [Gimesia sp.]|nr:hypothetical protein [Gimesia sp.]